METEISGRLLITGDLHGDTAALTMITRQLREGDALFVAGDFGFVFWDNRDEHVFLDDLTVADVEKALQTKLRILQSDG